MRGPWIFVAMLAASIAFRVAKADERWLDKNLHHLRAGGEREWSDFPEKPEGPKLAIQFSAQSNSAEFSLRLRQQDVKQPWRVLLNEKELGRLALDESDTVVYFTVPAGRLRKGDNVLSIEQTNRITDDIRVGEVFLDPRALNEVLSESSVDVRVLDVTQADTPTLTPCRLTIVSADGALVTTSARSNESLAVRPGVIYTADGRARFGLPAGEYTLYAGRGFEYGIDSVRLSLNASGVVQKELKIVREVATEAYVSCDTHIHTLTHSGHGDATIDERMITIAGEGIELAVATDHNRHIDYEATARRHNVRQFFTPVVGNEVTTALGHFNIFPVAADGDVPDHTLKDGHAILDNIAQRSKAKAIVLNHPRDVHGGFRPFGAERHNSATGENAAAWLFRAPAVEMVNSGAQQSDVMAPFADWFGLLNRGIFLTPVGASDSHDVSRFIVGQGRTYIRCRDDRPGEIDVDQAVQAFIAGRVLVSCGLLVELTVNDKYRSGDIVPASEVIEAKVEVRGPSWIRADRVTLYANGVPLHEDAISDDGRAGVKWRQTRTLPRFEHDVHLVAIATGPGVEALYWPIAKPYQATSPVVNRRVIGSTGAVWIDNDGDGKRTCSFDYARRLMAKHNNRAAEIIRSLADYDEAIAIQIAALFDAQRVSLDDPEIRSAARNAGPHVDRGFQAFLKAKRAGEIARSMMR
jgi:hypothetical protein